MSEAGSQRGEPPRPEGPADEDERREAYALAMSLEDGTPSAAGGRNEEIQRTARTLADSPDREAPPLRDDTGQRVRARVAAGLRARRARVRHRWVVAASAVAACGVLLLGLWWWVDRAQWKPPTPYRALFRQSFAPDSSPLDRLERIVAWRKGAR